MQVVASQPPIPLTNAEAWALVSATRSGRLLGTRYDASATGHSSPKAGQGPAARQPLPVFPEPDVSEHEVRVLFYLRGQQELSRALSAAAAASAEGGVPVASDAQQAATVCRATAAATAGILAAVRGRLGVRITAPEAMQLVNLRAADACGVYTVLQDLDTRTEAADAVVAAVLSAIAPLREPNA